MSFCSGPYVTLIDAVADLVAKCPAELAAVGQGTTQDLPPVSRIPHGGVPLSETQALVHHGGTEIHQSALPIGPLLKAGIEPGGDPRLALNMDLAGVGVVEAELTAMTSTAQGPAVVDVLPGRGAQHRLDDGEFGVADMLLLSFG
ncbi:hypothetical protein [Streptomyces sp. MS2.AVA.5]|uniref:Uncharacterized protein n=1 Tax=Streptomyces achmelvichensis TaxID=3134111 RepID=A0ACC6PL52_9ACTN